MQKFVRYLPITKVDEEERMVYGFASTPDLDSDGEIITLEAITKALPSYMQFPTIREMHQSKAAGTTKTAEVKNSKREKGLWIGAKIVANDAWEMVKEGVYKGFSVGGHVVQKVGNVIHELELVEISLVDVPANKAAKIEVWKSDMNKNAEGVYSLTMIMIQLKDYISYCKYQGKNTKKLEKILETIKQAITVEAEETEKEAEENNEMNGDFWAASPTNLIKRVGALEAMDFKGDAIADALRRGVIIAMKTKAEQIKKAEEEDAQKDETQADEEESHAEETESETEDEDEEEKEAAANATLKKLNDLDKKIEALTPKKDVSKAETLDLAKSVNAMAGTLAKAVDLLSNLTERVAKLEGTPAAAKSKSVAVFKSQEDKAEQTGADTNVVKETPEIEAKKSRLVELQKAYSEMGPEAYAKAGFGMEAGKLMGEIDQLRSRAARQ